jgi:hypothetical protein
MQWRQGGGDTVGAKGMARVASQYNMSPKRWINSGTGGDDLSEHTSVLDHDGTEAVQRDRNSEYESGRRARCLEENVHSIGPKRRPLLVDLYVQ